MKWLKKATRCVFFLACAAIAVAFVYRQFFQVQNIFDQMYYTRVRNYYDWWEGGLGGPGNAETSFENMPQIERVSRDMESYYTSAGFFESDYKDEYLCAGESLVMAFDRDEKNMMIIAVKRFDKFDIIFRYTYDIREKRLVEVVECAYGELYSGKSNEYLESYRERSNDLQQILLVIGEAGLTKADLLGYKKYFLCDKLLTDWSNANLSRFSVNRWGRIHYIETLVPEVGG